MNPVTMKAHHICHRDLVCHRGVWKAVEGIEAAQYSIVLRFEDGVTLRCSPTSLHKVMPSTLGEAIRAI